MNYTFARLLVYIFLTNCITTHCFVGQAHPWQYVGNLKHLYTAAESDITLLYQGQRIATSEGMFLFKNPTPYQPLVLLFINLEYVSLSGNENTVWYLTAQEQSKYQAFLCTPIIKSTGELSWLIQPGSLPESFDDEQHKKLIIPYNALIIPLSPDLFAQGADGQILFEKKTQVITSVTIELPMPTGIQVDKKRLQQAVLASTLSLINLRPLHAEQEAHRVRRDHLLVTLLK